MTVRTQLDSPYVADFMTLNHRVFLFCRDDDGRPIGYAMRSIAYDAATHWLFFATYTKSAKVRHLRADPDVACLVLPDEPSGDDTDWVSVRGTAEIYCPSATEIDAMIDTAQPDSRVPDAVAAKVKARLLSGKRSFIRLTLDEVRAAHLSVIPVSGQDPRGY